MKIVFRILVLSISISCLSQISLAQDPAKQSPDKYKIILDNSRVRVLDVRLKPGDKSPMHGHPDYVIYGLNGGKVRFTDAKGKTSEMSIKPGQCAFRRGEKHAVENIGKTTLHVLNVELKG